MRTILNLLFIAIFGMFLFSCEPYSSHAKRRSEKAAQASGDIVIGIVDSSKMPSLFAEGVRLAVEEINSGGGVMGRRIRPLFYDDENSLSKGQDIAIKLSENTDVIAVVGHLDARVAIPVSVTYEENGIIFIAPSTTDQDLIREGSVYTFRNIPSDEDVAKEMADFVSRNKYKKVAIVFDSESPGKRLAGIFNKYAREKGVRIVTEKAYSGWEEDFRLLIADLLKEEAFDVLFLGGVLPSAANLIKQMRGMGLNVPVIGSELLDSPELWNVAGKAAEGTIISTVFDTKLPKTTTGNFVKAFNAKLGSDPDTWAAQGYDAIRLLAYAIEKGESSVPLLIGTTLRFLENWQGVTGKYSFKRDGNITGKAVFFKIIRNEKFQMLERELREDINPFEVMEETTLRLPVSGAITTIDPGLTEDTVSIEITEQLFLGLTAFDPKNYNPVPQLAISWTVSEDGNTYRFNMRKDIIWTDGKPVTAHDIVWAVRRNIMPATKSPYAYVMTILKNAEAVSKGTIKDAAQIGVRAIDDFTVEFELEHPAAYFPSMAGLWVFRPLPRHVIEKYKDRWTEPENIQSNGSYKLVAWEKSMVMILKKNPQYYEADKVSIPEVRYYIIPEGSVGLAMYKSNQLDVMGGGYLRLPPYEILRIASNNALSAQYFNEPLFCTEAYGINTKLPPMDNLLVRKAVSAVINRTLLLDLIAKGQEPATTYTRPPILGSVDPKENVGIQFNPDKARQWLSEAGYPEGRGFPEITLLYNESETHSANAKAVQRFLKYYLNINVKLDERKWENYEKLKNSSNTPHLYREAWCADYPDANNFLARFHPIKSKNLIGWNNTEFARLLDEAEKLSVPETRKKLYKRAEQILCEEECVVVPIYFETAHYLIKPRVKGWYNMAMGGQHIRNWRFEK